MPRFRIDAHYTQYESGIIEADNREEADQMYYDGEVDLDATDSEDSEIDEITELDDDGEEIHRNTTMTGRTDRIVLMEE